MLQVAWEWMRHDAWPTTGWPAVSEDALPRDGGKASGERKKEQGMYQWKYIDGGEDGEGQVMKELEAVVRDAGKDEGMRG